MPGRAQIFQYEFCGSTDTIHITQDTLDTSTGIPLGDKSAGRGVLSFKYTGLDNNQFFNRENFGIFFEAEGTKDMRASWRLTSQSLNDGTGDIMTSLITQLQGPGCWDNCYYRHDSVVMQFYNPAEVFQFDCSWSEDENRSKIRCVVTKPSDPDYYVTFWSHMLDRYVSLIFLGVGKNAYPGDYPSYQAAVSDFKLTLFE